MKVLITGASGYIGNNLALRLANSGFAIQALVRSEAKTRSLVHPNIRLFKGDVCDAQSLQQATYGCSQVYHTAAKVGAWAEDPLSFYDVNVMGTNNVLTAARECGVEKVVITSTSGVFGPTTGSPLTETAQRTIDFQIDYDRSKKEAENVAKSHLEKGLNVVVVNPAKVYGPGATSHGMTANAIIKKFLKNRVTFIPSPGIQQVCFAFVDDVVEGHILAMKNGISGEQYILGGTNISYFEFFNHLRRIAQIKASIIPLPKKVIKLWAHLQDFNHKLLGVPIQFPVTSVDHVFSNYTFSSEKASAQLGYHITPLEKALVKTINYLQNTHHG